MSEVTVVVPAYNAEKYLSETLDSIKNQTVKPHEVIVVDDASKDQTAQIARLYSTFISLRLIRHERNCGIGKTRNDGAKQAKTKYVAFLSSDDVYLPEFIEKSLPFLDENTATYTVYHRCDENMRLKSMFTPPEYSRGSVVEWALNKNMYVNFSSVIMPRSIFDKVGFLPELRHGEDLIFLLDTVKADLNWKLVSEPLLRYRLHANQGTFTQKPEEFYDLWRCLIPRLVSLGVKASVVDKRFDESVKHCFPPLHRRLMAKVYHRLWGYR